MRVRRLASASLAVLLVVTGSAAADVVNIDTSGSPSSDLVTPDGSAVVYVSSGETTQVRAIDAASPRSRLLVDLGSDTATKLVVDDAYVVFLRTTGQVVEVWSADLDGSDARRLNDDLVDGGDVSSFRLAGGVVVYAADSTTNGRTDIHSVAVGGGSVRVLSTGIPPVAEYDVTTDGSHAVMKADDATLHSAATATDSRSQVDADVRDFAVAADDIVTLVDLTFPNAAVFTMHEDGANRTLRDPASESGNPTANMSLDTAVFSDGFGYVAYQVSSLGLAAWRFPLRGNGNAQRLSQRLSETLGIDEFVLSADHLVIRMTIGPVYSVPQVPAPASQNRLDPGSESNITTSWIQLTPNDDVLILIDSVESGEPQLHVAPADGSAAARRITNATTGVRNPHQSANGEIELTPDGDVVYVAIEERDEVWQVPLDGDTDDAIRLAGDPTTVVAVTNDGSVYVGAGTSVGEVAPGRVGDLRAAAGDGEITVAWTAATDDGGKPITVHLVDLISDGKVIASTTTAGTSLRIDGLTNGQPVRVRVRAKNKRATGNSQISNQVIPVDRGVVRLAGDNRFGTGAAVATSAFPDPVNVVFVATGRGFADALTGGPLAARNDAPVILVNTNDLPPESADELARLAPKRVVILGGQVAVSDAVEDAIATVTGVMPERIAGGSRFSTAAAIATEFPTGRDVFVAVGRNFPDALAGSALAAARDVPILLTEKDVLPDETSDAIRRMAPDTITILGGEAVVSKKVADELAALADDVVRLAGEDRFATAAAIADEFPQPVGSAYLATGRNFPDALTGAAAAARGGNPLLLTEVDRIPDVIAAALDRLEPVQIVILGGKLAVSKDVEQAVGAFLRAA